MFKEGYSETVEQQIFFSSYQTVINPFRPNQELSYSWGQPFARSPGKPLKSMHFGRNSKAVLWKPQLKLSRPTPTSMG